ncbi:hypothetical protein SELMODRAFT_432678, partial [Selaginella moellendorffii]
SSPLYFPSSQIPKSLQATNVLQELADVSKLAKCNMLHALLVNNRSRLNLIPKYMYNPAVALRDTVIELEVAIEGGKDSLSMAVQAGGETVKALANLVISHWRGSCSFVGTGKGRLGGFALAQFFDQISDTCLDVEIFKTCLQCDTDLIGKKLISAGHDIRVIVSLLSFHSFIVFARNYGIEVDIRTL